MSKFLPDQYVIMNVARLIENRNSLFLFSIKTLPMMAFENLNSLEIINLQNNKLTRVPEEALEAIVDTATVIDIMGK